MFNFRLILRFVCNNEHTNIHLPQKIGLWDGMRIDRIFSNMFFFYVVLIIFFEMKCENLSNAFFERQQLFTVVDQWDVRLDENYVAVNRYDMVICGNKYVLTIFVLDYGLVGRIVNLLTWMWIAIRVHFVSCSPKWKEICC